MKSAVVDADERGRVRRATAAVNRANFEVDARLLVELIDSGSAPDLLAGDLFRPVDDPAVKQKKPKATKPIDRKRRSR